MLETHDANTNLAFCRYKSFCGIMTIQTLLLCFTFDFSIFHGNSKHSTALIAGLDGTVHLVESNSKRVIWSFESGTPIYTSYQATSGQDNDKENASDPSGRFFIDCGDDWDLYMHSEHFGKTVWCLVCVSYINAFFFFFFFL